MASERLRLISRTVAGLLWVLLVTGIGRAGPDEFQRQTISVPTRTGAWQAWRMSLFADVDHDGLSDLLAVGAAENTLWIYRQRASGFVGVPDQALALPQQTAWIALCDVEGHGDADLLVSTATGLVYLRQNQGVFEAQPRTLLVADQIFPNGAPPILTSLAGQKDATNSEIPVITAGQAVLYTRNSPGKWSPGQPIPLHLTRARWNAEPSGWRTASDTSQSVNIRQSFQADPSEGLVTESKAENAAIRKLLLDVEREGPGLWHGLDRLDVNGDGRDDLVFWQIVGDLDPRTDVFIFLRGADNKLPERPTQVLHCRGFPVTVGPRQRVSPLCDLDGDGICELVLLAPKPTITSWSSLVDMAVSRGVDCVLTIRSCERGAFSRSPEASTNLTTMLPSGQGLHEFVVIEGDFNGDGRRDVLVRRSLTQWDVFVSSTGGGWFAPKPTLQFEIPMEGTFDIEDLNGDGLSDLVVHGLDEPRIVIFLSRSHRTQGPKP
jgi:hypothetical protein